jgi:hypothetical protein
MIDTKQLRETILSSRDPSLEIFKIRDLPEIKDAGLYDLAWGLCRDCHRNDALGFVDYLEEWQKQQLCIDCDLNNPSCDRCLGV